jgi:hypothetical protein
MTTKRSRLAGSLVVGCLLAGGVGYAAVRRALPRASLAESHYGGLLPGDGPARAEQRSGAAPGTSRPGGAAGAQRALAALTAAQGAPPQKVTDADEEGILERAEQRGKTMRSPPDPISTAPMEKSDLPVLRLLVAAPGGPILDEPKVGGTLSLFLAGSCPIGKLKKCRPTASASVRVELRGNSSLRLSPKKSYGFVLQEEPHGAALTNALELPRRDKWILQACYADRTCLRNRLAYAIAAAMGRPAPEVRFVELVVGDQYQGLYTLLPRPSRAMLSLPPVSHSDVTGGYIIRREGVGKAGGRSWRARSGLMWTYHYPAADVITDQQRQYLRDFLDRVEEQIELGEHGNNGFSAVLDLDSWVDYALLQELANNVDAYWKSMFVYKMPDRLGGRLFLGPAWDFDIAFGNADFRGGWRTDVWAFTADEQEGDQDVVPGFWQALWSNPLFVRRAATRWQALQQHVLEPGRLDARLDKWQIEIAAARRRDQRRWGTAGRRLWPNHYVGDDDAGDVQILKAWIHRRIAWLVGSISRLRGP